MAFEKTTKMYFYFTVTKVVAWKCLNFIGPFHFTIKKTWHSIHAVPGIQAEPLKAPSYAQVVQRKKRDDPAVLKDVFMKSVKELLKNKGYILLLISYGINVGAFFAISTLLNQFILRYFPVSKFKIISCLWYI